jgi:hypothetical protein
MANCPVCEQSLKHKAGRYSMNCRCPVKPCKHRLVCNACGVFFADETVKRRKDPGRCHPCEHMHRDDFKVRCAACSSERYARCLAAHMSPNRVGNRKKRSPKKPKRLVKPHTSPPPPLSQFRMSCLGDAAAWLEASHSESDEPGSPASCAGSPPHAGGSADEVFAGLRLLSMAAEIELRASG